MAMFSKRIRITRASGARMSPALAVALAPLLAGPLIAAAGASEAPSRASAMTAYVAAEDSFAPLGVLQPVESARGRAASLAATQRISQPIIIPHPPGWPLFPCYGPGSMPWPTPVGAPTAQPRPSPTPGPATGLAYRACPQLGRKVPPMVQQQAVSEPWQLYGYGMLQNPNVPYHPIWNPYRTWLSLLDYGKPWNPCNPIVLKAGCP